VATLAGLHRSPRAKCGRGKREPTAEPRGIYRVIRGIVFVSRHAGTLEDRKSSADGCGNSLLDFTGVPS
jgi:hypothetical protein